MSYYKIKSLSINEKKNKITLTAACNNIRPLYYFTDEYMKEEKDFNKKLATLLRDILDGNLHLAPSSNKALYCLMYSNNEERRKIKEWSEHNIWQFDVEWDKQVKRSEEEYNALICELDSMLLDYYRKHIEEIKKELKGKQYVIVYNGYYYVKSINRRSVRYGCHINNAKRITKVEFESLQSAWGDRIKLEEV